METSGVQPANGTASRDLDSALASLVEQLTLLLKQDDQAGVQRLLEDHPDHAAELRSMLPTLQVLVELQGPGARQVTVAAPVTPPLGDFRLLREVGRGGMGVVYEAEQLSLSRRVAVKVLPFAAVLDPRCLQRFKNEALAAAQLDHPNIVEVFGVGCDRCIHFYAMRFVDGQTLAAIIDGLQRELSALGHPVKVSLELNAECSNDRSSSSAARETVQLAALSTLRAQRPQEYFRRIADFGMQIADALDHAHQAGIVHRDVKPSNLMLDHQGKVWITDFGLAHMESEQNLTLSGDLLGTLRYMSPEQADGAADIVDRRSDVYSLGVTLYELLTLQPAFSGRDSKALLRQIVTADPVPPRRLNHAIPLDLETIILKSIAKSPADRYRSARELADDFRRFVARQPIQARPLGRIGRTWRWYKRSPVVAGLLTAVVLLALVAATTGMMFGLRESAHRRHAEAAAEEAHWQQYVSDIHSAMAAWEQSNVGRTLELLERHRPRPGEPDLRGFEWNYLWRRCHETRPSVTINETSYVWRVMFSHDGQWIATGNAEGIVRVWDANSGWLKQEFTEHQVGVTWVTVSPDDRYLASGDHSGMIYLRDLANPGAARVLNGHQGQILGLIFSSDGKQLASGCDDLTIRTWEVATGHELRVIRPQMRLLAALRPITPWVDQRLWDFEQNGVLRLFDSDTGTELRSIERKELSNNRAIARVSWDGRMGATAGPDGVIRLFDIETGRDHETLGAHGTAVCAMAFARDNQTLASSDTLGKVIVWDVAERTRRMELQGHAGPVAVIAFSADSQRLCTSGADHKLLIWDLARLRAPAEMRHRAMVLCVAFSPDGRLLATGGPEPKRGVVKLWETATGRFIHQFEGHTDWVQSVAFSPDGNELASTGDDGTLRLWDVASRKARATIDAEKLKWWVSYSRDGRELIASETNGTLRVWDRSTGAENRSAKIGKSFYIKPALSPDGRTLVAGVDQSIVVLEYPSLKPVRRFPRSLVYGNTIAISPDGRTIATCGVSNEVYLSSLDGQPLGVLQHAAEVWSVDFSSDGHNLVSGDMNYEVHLWDVDRLERRATFRGHYAWVDMVRFSPDGKTIASASDDGTVRLWHSEPPLD
jgi:WD40 repeat protein/serine/threonine protein kinase